MNREEMDTFLTSLYRRAYRDGESSKIKLDTIGFLAEVLGNTKGVGEVLSTRILMEAQSKLRVGTKEE